jgi:hypothetical protein
VTNFGAVGDGVHDDAPNIQNAVNGCPAGQVVFIPAGTYRLNSQIQISKSITLRGASASTVTLNCYAAWHCIQMGDWPGNPVATNVSGSPAKGAATLTVASITSPSLSVGDYISIDQIDDGVEVVNADGTGGTGIQNCAGEKRGTNRCLGQTVKITGISGLVLTIDPPLYHAYSAAQTPQVWKLNQDITMVFQAGVESLKVERISPTGSEGYHNFKIIACSQCWLKNIESKKTETWHVDLDRSFQCEIRDSFFNDAWTFTGGQGYGVSLSWTFATLVENNILYHTRHAMLVRDGSGGNVFGYNYSVDSDQGDGWLAADMNSHGHHPTMNLWEGNIGAKIYGDFTWGSSSYHTFFRNWAIRDSAAAPTNSLRAVDIETHNWYYNIVGNVLGQSGQTWNAYDPGTTRSTSGRYVYTFGYFSDGQTTSVDPQSLATVFRNGNFDYQSNSTIWDAGTTDHTLPGSLYLTAKPAFFGGLPWPAIGPDVNPRNGTIPARERYEGRAIPPSGAPSAPTGLRIVP